MELFYVVLTCTGPYTYREHVNAPATRQRPGAWTTRKRRAAMPQPTRTLPQLLQPVARAATSVALTVAGFFALFAPSLITGPM